MKRSRRLVLFLMLALAPPALAEPSNPQLQAVKSFAFALGAELNSSMLLRLTRYDLVVVDGEGASSDDVAVLRGNGVLVFGYLSVGTIEPYRSWYSKLKPYRLTFWDDWGEYIARASSPEYRRIISKQIAPGIMAKGFDGLFIDNVDISETFPGQKNGMTLLVAQLSARLRAEGRLLFAQNGSTQIDGILPYLDAWNQEDVTSTYNFDNSRYERVSKADRRARLAALRRLAAAGLLVTATDYVRAGDRISEAKAKLNACQAGALPFISNILLTRIAKRPYRCD